MSKLWVLNSNSSRLSGHGVFKSPDFCTSLSSGLPERSAPCSLPVTYNLSADPLVHIISLVLARVCISLGNPFAFGQSSSREVLVVRYLFALLWNVSSWTHESRGWHLVLQSWCPCLSSSVSECELGLLDVFELLRRHVLRARRPHLLCSSESAFSPELHGGSSIPPVVISSVWHV